MSQKRRLAVEWSIESLIEGNDKAYFWTLTTKEEETPQDMSGMWDALLKELQRILGKFDFIRVIEPHKSHRRFHYHMVCNAFLDVNVVRRIAEGYGWGRLDVRLVRDRAKMPSYLAKYLAKAKRCPALKKVRLFSMSLRPQTFVKNCIRDIVYRENGKTCRELYGPLLARLPRFQRFAEARRMMGQAKNETLWLRDWLLSEANGIESVGMDVEADTLRTWVQFPEGRYVYETSAD